MGTKEETQKDSDKDDKNRVSFDTDKKEAKMEEGKNNEKKPMPKLPKPLTIEEKKYLLSVERGDNNTVRKMLQKNHRHPEYMNKNCVDPLGRGALHMAVDNENLEMVELLVVMGVETKDALLHAIDVEFVEAVEVLLEHEEVIHKEGEPYSWERVDRETASFTPEITPLILAAHRDNYEILKILLDRGAMLPMPHDIRCGCEDCIHTSTEDSLRHSMSRINSYRALASPSLIALSSTDPILTAFELSWELKSLAYDEHEFRAEYLELRRQCRDFAEELLNYTRSSTELAVILNYDPESVPYEEGEHMKLRRLELAIDYKQKKFVAHANVQQLLAAIWYEGLPGFRRKSAMEKLQDVVKLVALFPFYCMHYMIMPESPTGKLMRTPFMKFLIHSASYLFFLLLLILVSVRFEDLVIFLFGTDSMREWLEEKRQIQRGNLPTPTECFVFFYVFGFIWEEISEIKNQGIKKYFKNMWNLLDVLRDSLYIMTILLRIGAFLQQSFEISNDPQTAYIRKEEWDTVDPQLISEGLFSAANILSALKLVHIFSINPYLGPLQISLGRMVIDIVKFFFIYSLVLFAFACGLTQLLWYYNDLEKRKCYSLPGGLADWNRQGDACMKWRRFHNVFEASQSLFWAGFGMVGLSDFELTGIREYTRFWSMLMFGTYSVINIIVLLNLLIAMMSNSYSFIVEHADSEWKFARTKLWMSYFEEGKTLPPPFNVLPNIKHFRKYVLKTTSESSKAKRMSTRTQRVQRKARDYRYLAVMRALIWRYVCSLQKRNVEAPVTEDDINEVKGDISSLRFELIDLFENNGMDVSNCSKKSKAALGRKMKMWERRLMRDFHVSPAMGGEGEGETSVQVPPENGKSNAASHFKKIAKLAMTPKIADVASVVSGKAAVSQIGRTVKGDDAGRDNLKKAMERARQKMEEDTPDNSPGSSRGCSPFPDLYTGPHLLDTINSLQLSPLGSVASTPMPTDSTYKLMTDAEAKDHNLLTIPGRRSASKLSEKGTGGGEMSLNVPSDVFSLGLLKSMVQEKNQINSEESSNDATADTSSKIPQVTVLTVSEKNSDLVKKSEEKTQSKSSNLVGTKESKIDSKKPELTTPSPCDPKKTRGMLTKNEDSNLDTNTIEKTSVTSFKSETPLQPPIGKIALPKPGPKDVPEVKRDSSKPSPLRIDIRSACISGGESYGIPRSGPHGIAASSKILPAKDLPPATHYSKQQSDKTDLPNTEVVRKPRNLSKQHSTDKLDGVKPLAPQIPKQAKPTEAAKPIVECSDKGKIAADKSAAHPVISVIPSTPCGTDSPSEIRKQKIQTNKNDNKTQKEIPKAKNETPVNEEGKPKGDQPQATQPTKIPHILHQSSKDMPAPEPVKTKPAPEPVKTKPAPEPVKQPAKIEKDKVTSAPLPPNETKTPKSKGNADEKKTTSTLGKKGGWL